MGPKGEACMTQFNPRLAIAGLFIGLFFISHAAGSAAAQQRNYRFQHDLQQLQQQQQIDQLQRQLDQIQREPMGQRERQQQSNDLQQQLDQRQLDQQQNQLREAQ